jgi:hypothetical protein
LSVAPIPAVIRQTSPLTRMLELVLCGVLPVLVVYEATIGQALSGNPTGWHFAIDFHHVWRAGRDVLHGTSPYLTPAELGGLAPGDIHAFVYPAPLALAATPFGLLPYGVAGGIYVVMLIAALALGLWLLGVRDWRCYGVAFLFVPVLTAVSVGTLTPLLFLGTAAAWRYRDRRWVAAVAVAGLIVIKIFLWPLVLWLLFTRRKSSAALAVVMAVASSVISWWAIGFAGFGSFPALLRTLSRVEYATSYSPAALAHSLGAGRTVAYAVAALASVGLVMALVQAARRDPDGPLPLTLAIGLGLVTSPVVWLHYFALWLAPLAIYRSRLSPPWLLPLLFWVIPAQQADGQTWRIALAGAVSMGLLAWSVPRGDLVKTFALLPVFPRSYAFRRPC